MKSIAQVVNDSAKCYFSQLVSDENGSMIVPTYNWTDFFAPRIKKVVGIKKYHHFRCDSSQPGVVFVKEHADTNEQTIDLMKLTPRWSPDLSELPSAVPPKGLSIENCGTCMRVSAQFVLIVTRISLVLCRMSLRQAVHQGHQSDTHNRQLKTTYLLHKETLVWHLQAGRA